MKTAAAFFLVAWVATAHAQPRPHLAYVYPAGGKQGTTVTVSVGGQNLNNASAAYFAGAGLHAKVTGYDRPLTQKEINDLREKADELQAKRVAAKADATKPPFTAEDEKIVAELRHTLATRGNRQVPPALADTVTLEITFAPDAALGEHELRLKAAGGLSNPIVFRVDQLPEVSEPVVTATSARAASRPRAANLRAARTSATVTEVALPAMINGQILPGEVDRFRFAARKGQRLVFATAARALMPYLADAVPGWFQATLALFDAQGRELAYDDDFRFNPDPVLMCEIPADGTYTLEIKDAIYRGREDFVYRIAAGELPFVTSIFPLGCAVGAPATFSLTGWNLPVETLTVDTLAQTPGMFVLSVREHGLLSNPVRFVLNTQPGVAAAETNLSIEAAQSLALPAVVNGRIGHAGEERVFRFEAKAGDEIVAEVLARRLGSPLDSTLTLADATGRTVASNDDWEDRGAGLLTHHADSHLGVKLPADGTYILRLADAQRQGGPDYGYRLRVGPPQPDFELRVTPSTLNARASAAVPITVYALRRDGFSGEIKLALSHAPPGCALNGARIPANADKVQLTLTAPALPRDEPFDLRIVGTATIGGKTVAHGAVPAEDMMQAFAYRHLVPAKELKVAVAGRSAAFRVVSKVPVQIPVGGSVRVRINSPAARFAANVQLELSQAPEGLSVKRCSTSGDTIEVELVCDAAKAKAGQRGNLLLNAFGGRDAGKQKSGKAGNPQRNALGTVPAIPFEIVAAAENDPRA